MTFVTFYNKISRPTFHPMRVTSWLTLILSCCFILGSDLPHTHRAVVAVPTTVGSIFSNRVVNRWNMLDQQIVGATGLNAFKMDWMQ